MDSTSYSKRRNSLLVDKRSSLSFLCHEDSFGSTLTAAREELYDVVIEDPKNVDIRSSCPSSKISYSIMNPQAKGCSLGIAMENPQSKRCSLGISTADLQELMQDGRPSFHKRSSLDLLFNIPSVEYNHGEVEYRSIKGMRIQRKSIAFHPTSYSNPLDINCNVNRSDKNNQADISGPLEIMPSIDEKSSARDIHHSKSPFHPFSPTYSQGFVKKYEIYLKNLLHLMEKSERSRSEMFKIRRYMKNLQNNSPRTSFAEIKSSMRKKREMEAVNNAARDHVKLQNAASTNLRRRSSLTVQSFKLQFFPDCI